MSHEEIAKLECGIDNLGLHRQNAGSPAVRSTNAKRISLMETDGILRWDLGGRRSRNSGSMVTSYQFEEIPPNLIAKKLGELDLWLNSNQGLHRVEEAEIRDDNIIPRKNGKILLFVHGTFSKCENLLSSWINTDHGQDFLNWASHQYDEVLAFNHPTLSVSPAINALALSRAFRNSHAEVDIVCHSRGGLVVRWWLEAFRSNLGRTRVVFVGCPLGGTGIASPGNLRSTLDLLANYSRQLAFCSGVGGFVFPVAAPIFQATAFLARIVSSITSVGATVPAFDLALSTVPGLAAQSRQGANYELLALRDGFSEVHQSDLANVVRQYHYVVSNFENAADGWSFWKQFRVAAAADRVTDLVFDGPNDLVVDTNSMTDLADELKSQDHDSQTLDFGTSDVVHHCNYFQNASTNLFIRDVFR